VRDCSQLLCVCLRSTQIRAKLLRLFARKTRSVSIFPDSTQHRRDQGEYKSIQTAFCITDRPAVSQPCYFSTPPFTFHLSLHVYRSPHRTGRALQYMQRDAFRAQYYLLASEDATCYSAYRLCLALNHASNVFYVVSIVDTSLCSQQL
jgi:hypothetical protein